MRFVGLFSNRIELDMSAMLAPMLNAPHPAAAHLPMQNYHQLTPAPLLPAFDTIKPLSTADVARESKCNLSAI